MALPKKQMPPKQLKLIIVGSILAISVSGVALLLYAGNHLGEALSGPGKLARAPDDTLWVASYGHLHQFNGDGTRLQKVALAELGLTGLVSGIAVAGNNIVFIAQAEPSGIHRCTLPQKTCTDLTPVVAKTGRATAHALMLAADWTGNRLVVSDNAAHRLLLMDFDGNVLDRSVPRRFLFPNQPSWLSSDEIAIADTNHHRIVTVGINDSRIAEERNTFATDTNRYQRPGRTWPMDAQRDRDGRWWVLNAQNGMRNADLLRFDSDGKPLARVDLGVTSDPTAIALIGADVLVADPLHARLIRVSQAAAGFAQQAFGDAAFQSELRQLASDRIMWSRTRIAAQIMLVVGPLAGIFLLWRLGEPLVQSVARVKRPAGVEPRPVNGVHWLAVNPRFGRRIRWLWLTHLVLCVAATGVIYFWIDAISQPSFAAALWTIFWIFAGVMGIIILFDLYMMVRGSASTRIRLGTDGQVLLLGRKRALEQVERYPFASVATNGRQLLAGRHLVQLSSVVGVRFDREELAGYLLARMPNSAFVSAAEFLRRALQNGNRSIWFVMIVIVGLVALELLSILFPDLVAAWKTALSHALMSLMGLQR